MSTTIDTPGLYLRHESDARSERSLCGWRYRLLSEGDENVECWAHAVDIDGSKAHYHKIGTELYYVVEGEGQLILDGVEHPVRKGSFAHIPPGVITAFLVAKLELRQTVLLAVKVRSRVMQW